MKYKLADTVRLTDFQNGRLECAHSGRFVEGSALHRAIAVHFRTGALWADFEPMSDAATAAFDTMCQAGLLVSSDVAGPVLARPEATMFEVPFRELNDVSEGEIVFLGAPIDIGTSSYPGARFGPQSIRAASSERYQCRFDIESGAMIAWNVPSLGGGVLGGARLSDVGDLVYVPGEPAEHYYQRLREVVGRIYDAGAFPVVLGGDHSITYATVPNDPVDLVHLDAHCDLAERVVGHCHHHGNVLRRLLDEARVQDIHHFGLRDTAGWDTLHAGTFAKGVGDLDLEGWEAGIRDKTVFISLDVDVLDPTVLPGTGTPVVGGLTLRQLCQVLARIVQVTRPVGLDVVELCPIRDETGLSERTVVEVLLCFLAVYHSTTTSPLS